MPCMACAVLHYQIPRLKKNLLVVIKLKLDLPCKANAVIDRISLMESVIHCPVFHFIEEARNLLCSTGNTEITGIEQY